MERQTNRETIVVKLAEWGITVTENELDELLLAYQKMLQWQGILEEMLHQRKIAEGMTWPQSEPLLIHCLWGKGGSR